MKTKSNIQFLFVLSLITILSVFTACSDDDGDTTPPVIQLNKPAESAKLLIGSTICLDMELSDDEMLSSYKVEIHNNFDGHEHTRAEDGTTPFQFQKSWSVADQKNAKIHQHEIEIPEGATPGNYHLMVYCTDLAGNESYVARNIVLSHDGEGHEHEE
ncbi:DUF4625 domain-containing protein [Bacteroides sp. 51]|uniref:DUF4625 domain-containing protein n=1 Tax=Bacteroides sp. 51 TaxID=2302938 RepID=UPI0013D74018|nr:DUF4625 domain-containing protein [Bacteroides sp. 51]NDV81787.1 DUF4625 domain-containing protein [Bacteroides sp. 51]